MTQRLELVVPRQLCPTNPMANTISRVHTKSQGFKGWAEASSEVWMCREMGTGSFLVLKDFCEQNGTATGTVGTEPIASDKFDG